MGLPSKRRTKSSKRRRASHFAGTPVSLTTCSSCGSAVRPHHLCMNCGAYAGTTLLKVASKAEKKLRKREKVKKKEEENAKAPVAVA
ncbi:MAG: 50S ribosomal protein L32 [Candidatus Kerfeldbacteria bacterium]|nr:50S ribosomal protein L32 [Candidatus Kerfeldbacteria bacterium]